MTLGEEKIKSPAFDRGGKSSSAPLPIRYTHTESRMNKVIGTLSGRTMHPDSLARISHYDPQILLSLELDSRFHGNNKEGK